MSRDEKIVLESIWKLAVRTENTMITRVALRIHDMHQDRDEPVRSFCARLMGQANICKYSVLLATSCFIVSCVNVRCE